MALLLKDANGNLVSLANKSDKWAVYATKAAAEEALVNDELAEGMIVGVTESPGVISEGSSVITSTSATLPIVASGPEVEFYTYTNTTASEVDLYASYYNNYPASTGDYYSGFYGVLNGATIVKTGQSAANYASTFLYVHLRPGDTVILKGKRSNSALATTVEIDISAPTIEYHTDKLYAIEPNYSTTEVNTGKKWIDGKPIYRKVYYSATNWANGTVLDTISDIGFVVHIRDIAATGESQYYDTFSDDTSIAKTFVVNGVITVRRTAAFANQKPSAVIIEYTKIGD